MCHVAETPYDERYHESPFYNGTHYNQYTWQEFEKESTKEL
jgi:hypothetical protein